MHSAIQSERGPLAPSFSQRSGTHDQHTSLPMGNPQRTDLRLASLGVWWAPPQSNSLGENGHSSLSQQTPWLPFLAHHRASWQKAQLPISPQGEKECVETCRISNQADRWRLSPVQGHIIKARSGAKATIIWNSLA